MFTSFRAVRNTNRSIHKDTPKTILHAYDLNAQTSAISEIPLVPLSSPVQLLSYLLRLSHSEEYSYILKVGFISLTFVTASFNSAFACLYERQII
jgi:hypothetical protein